jgi:hypothetical protein
MVGKRSTHAKSDKVREKTDGWFAEVDPENDVGASLRTI